MLPHQPLRQMEETRYKITGSTNNRIFSYAYFHIQSRHTCWSTHPSFCSISWRVKGTPYHDPHRNTGRNGCPDHRRTAPVGDIGGDCLEGLVCSQSGRAKFVRIRRSANHCYCPVRDNSTSCCRLDNNPYARFGEEDRWRWMKTFPYRPKIGRAH